MDYKLKYLKYKAKYLELKEQQAGADILEMPNLGIYDSLSKGRMFKYNATIDKEVDKINTIINEHDLLKDLKRNEKGQVKVKEFLDIIKNKIKTDKTLDTKKKEELNYLLENHKICKKLTSFVYDVDKCFTVRVPNTNK
jgi:hypothetical protein